MLPKPHVGLSDMRLATRPRKCSSCSSYHKITQEKGAVPSHRAFTTQVLSDSFDGTTRSARKHVFDGSTYIQHRSDQKSRELEQRLSEVQYLLKPQVRRPRCTTSDSDEALAKYRPCQGPYSYYTVMPRYSKHSFLAGRSLCGYPANLRVANSNANANANSSLTATKERPTFWTCPTLIAI